MDDFDLDSFLGDMGMEPSLDTSTWGDTSGFGFGDISNAVNGTDFSGVDLNNIDFGGIDVNSFLSDLGSMGTDLGPSSSMGMDQELLNQIGLGDLSGGDTGGMTRSLVGAMSGSDANPAGLPAPTGSSEGLSKYALASDRKIPGTNLYKVGPNQVSANEDGTGMRMDTNPVEFKKDGSVDWNSLFSSGSGEPGIKMNDTLPSQDSMNGGQGLTYYRPTEYDASGKAIPGTGGTVTASGFVPDGSQHALGDPNSWINNPNITGQKGVTSANNVVTPNSKGITGLPTVNTTAGADKVTPGDNKTIIDKLKDVVNGGDKTNADDTKKGMDPMAMMMLMLMLSQMGKGGGSKSSAASMIPSLTSDRKQLPYTAPSRPGAGGVNYFSPNTYTQKAAGGGMMGYAGGGGISSLGGYSDGGRLLKGPGDGVSDNIPATIAGKQPARLANGEFVVPARIVSELGNGSTDAGAKRLYEMMDRVQKARRKTKNVAADTKAHKYLPA